MFISSGFFFSYVVNIIVTYIYRIRQRVSINNYKRVKCEENILLIKNSLDYRNLADGLCSAAEEFKWVPCFRNQSRAGKVF